MSWLSFYFLNSGQLGNCLLWLYFYLLISITLFLLFCFLNVCFCLEAPLKRLSSARKGARPNKQMKNGFGPTCCSQHPKACRENVGGRMSEYIPSHEKQQRGVTSSEHTLSICSKRFSCLLKMTQSYWMVLYIVRFLKYIYIYIYIHPHFSSFYGHLSSSSQVNNLKWYSGQQQTARG